MRIRLTFDVSDRVRRALGIVAARSVRGVGDVIEDMIEKLHPDALEQADRAIDAGETPEVKPGRKPKGKRE